MKQQAECGLINRAELEQQKLEQQTKTLAQVVRRINYAYQGENIEVLLPNGVSFVFHADGAAHQTGKHQPPNTQNRQKDIL